MPIGMNGETVTLGLCIVNINSSHSFDLICGVNGIEHPKQKQKKKNKREKEKIAAHTHTHIQHQHSQTVAKVETGERQIEDKK